MKQINRDYPAAAVAIPTLVYHSTAKCIIIGKLPEKGREVGGKIENETPIMTRERGRKVKKM